MVPIMPFLIFVEALIYNLGKFNTSEVSNIQSKYFQTLALSSSFDFRSSVCFLTSCTFLLHYLFVYNEHDICSNFIIEIKLQVHGQCYL